MQHPNTTRSNGNLGSIKQLLIRIRQIRWMAPVHNLASCQNFGIPGNMVRMSMGIEQPDNGQLPGTRGVQNCLWSQRRINHQGHAGL
jgi:hypothetical protein